MAVLKGHDQVEARPEFVATGVAVERTDGRLPSADPVTASLDSLPVQIGRYPVRVVDRYVFFGVLRRAAILRPKLMTSSAVPQTVIQPKRHSLSDVRFPQMLLNVGFVFALVVAAACLVMSSWYLFTFLSATNSAVEDLLRTASEHPETSATVVQLGILARTTMARFALLSCGVSVGMGFGFLGFALFLIGIKGEMDVAAQTENIQVKVARMAPGVFVILCACVLIAICITFRTEFNFAGGESSTKTAVTEQPSSSQSTTARSPERPSPNKP